MPQALVAWLRLALAGCVLLAQAAFAAPLVSVEWLKKNLGGDGLLLIDASSSRLHAARHIPGAVNVDLYRYGPGIHKALPSEMESRIQSWGVSPGGKVVIYDEGAGNMATWVYYELYYYGFPEANLAILDGGLARWEASGGAVTKEPTPAPVRGSFRVTAVREEVRTRGPEFLLATGDPAKHATVDAMDAPYHFGATKFFDRAGHIPNAIMAPAADFYNADKTFKSPEEIRRMAAYLGLQPGQPIHSHCGGGVAATVPWFALHRLARMPNVRVYRESQLEWLQDERGLPFWTYSAPYLKRDMVWVNAWGSPMLRMFGVAKLSVIDIRPAEEYRVNHLPYALSIPAAVFRKHLDDPASLAEVLGPAGVDPAHEAVIVSSGGLNPSSALAFLVLEKLGQKKVSLMMDSVDEWAMRGFVLTQEPTIVGKPATPKDMAVPAVAYKPAMRPGLVGKDPSGAALYPKVFVASGKQVPGKAQQGKVVHVPYTELVDANGNPRPAHEIWSTLAKAGVPRYAEIVTYSDDPGEAAVNYYVMRLMGFPDVKVLVL